MGRRYHELAVESFIAWFPLFHHPSAKSTSVTFFPVQSADVLPVFMVPTTRETLSPLFFWRRHHGGTFGVSSLQKVCCSRPRWAGRNQLDGMALLELFGDIEEARYKSTRRKNMFF